MKMHSTFLGSKSIVGVPLFFVINKVLDEPQNACTFDTMVL